MPLKAGDGVVPSSLTNNLFDMAEEYGNSDKTTKEVITGNNEVLVPVDMNKDFLKNISQNGVPTLSPNYNSFVGNQNIPVPDLPIQKVNNNTTISYGSLLTVNGNVDK